MTTQEIAADTEPLDLTDPGHLADPYPAYARLRADGGVHRSHRWDSWFVTRYDLCHAVFTDDRFDAVGQPFLRMLQAEVLKGGTSWRVPSARPPKDEDVAVRMAGRRTTGRALGSRFVDTLWPRFEQDCRDTVARLVREARSTEGSRDGDAPAAVRVDLVRDYAIPVVTRLLADLMAVGEADLPVFRAWAESGYGEHDDARMREIVRDIRRLLAHQAVGRLREPVDDFVGRLAAHRAQSSVGAHLEFVLGTGLMISLVTHQGLVLSFSTLLAALQRHPEQYALLREDPSLVPGTVEEGLRFDSSTQALGRLALADVELGGVTIPAGGLVVCFIGSANRDERQWPNAETFDVTRPVRATARNLTFGTGATSCLGAAISRRALTALLRALVDQVAELAPAGRPELFGEFMTRGYVRLPGMVTAADASA